MNNLAIICADDWEMLFVNGKLVYQDHSIPTRELGQWVPIGALTIEEASEELSEKLYDEGHIPPGTSLDKAREASW